MGWLLLIGLALAEDLTLAEAFERAMAQNLEQRSARLSEDRAEANVMAARGGFDPRLSVNTDLGSGRSPTNNALDGVDSLSTSSSGYGANLSQSLPGGGAVSVGFSERTSSSNSATQVSDQFVTDSLTLALSQPLLDGAGRASMYGVRSATLGLSDQQLAARAQAEQLCLSVSDAYWRLVAAERSLEFARVSVANTQQQLSDIQERFDEGFAGSGEVRQVERAVGVARQAEVIAEAELEAAQQALGRLMGVPIAELPDLRPVDLPAAAPPVPAVEEAFALALDNNSQWRRQELAFERARLDLQLNRNSALPDLSVNGYVGSSGLGDNPAEARAQLAQGVYRDLGVGADLSVALPARVDRAGLTQARLSFEQAELSLQAAREDLRIEVESAVRALERDALRVELAEQTLEAARASLAADQELFNEGKGSARDLVQTREALEQAQLSLLQAQIDRESSALRLQRAQGTLLDLVPTAR